MSITKKHHCPSCDGYLSIDNDKQMYRCTFCGSTYDFEYFRDDQMHQMGETYLSRREFNAAVEAYRFILEKDHHDFLALRGLMLASAHLTSVKELEQKNGKVGFIYDAKMAGEAIESASEEDKEYFAEFGKIYSDKKDLVDSTRKLDSMRRDLRRNDVDIQLTDDSRFDYYFKGKGNALTSPKAMFILVWCAIPFLSMYSLIFAAALGGSDGIGTLILAAIFIGFITLVCVGFNFSKVYPRMKEIKEIDAYLDKLRNDSGLLRANISELERDTEDLAETIRKSVTDFVKKDSLIMSDYVNEYGSKISDVKKHQCPSCGGPLNIDSDKQMYHCAFCGSTYDYEYFREDQMHEVGETYISRSEFKAAAEAYDFTLKKDPHDFLALRGMVLAAANLSGMNELERDVDATEFEYDLQVVNEAIEKASGKDKEYFKELGQVYSDRKRLAEYNRELNSLWNEKDKINSVIAGNNLERKEYYISSKNGANANPKYEFLIVTCVAGFLLMFEFFFVYGFFKYLGKDPSGEETFSALATTTGLFAAGALAYDLFFVLPKYLRLRKLDKGNSKLYVESGNMDEKIKALENATDKLRNDIKRSIHDFVKKDRLIMRDKQ